MLTSKQRAILKQNAQRIKPTVQIGAAELHENSIKAINDSLNNKELVKIKVNRIDKTNKKITREIANELEQKASLDVVDVIGTTIIVYRESKDPENRILN